MNLLDLIKENIVCCGHYRGWNTKSKKHYIPQNWPENKIKGSDSFRHFLRRAVLDDVQEQLCNLKRQSKLISLRKNEQKILVKSKTST